MKRICEEEQLSLDQKPFIISLLYSLLTFRHTPVILLDGQLKSHGRTPQYTELQQWVQDARREHSHHP